MPLKELKKILYAEDEPDIQTVTQLALIDIGGLDVKTCNNGQEVIDTIKDFAPDLVLLDVMMPIMDGPTALTQLNEMDALDGIPVIFMTAKAQKHEIDEYLNMGATDIIAKPFDPMTLAATIKEIYAKTLTP